MGYASGIKMAGLGAGMMEGMERFRRHQAEDEDREQKREAHGLNMEAGRFNLDNAKADRPLQRRALERADAQGGRDEWINDMAHRANEALAKAQTGDLNAINEFSMSVVPDPEMAPLVMPAESEEDMRRGMVLFGPAGQQKLTPLSEVLQHVAKAGSPDTVRQMLLENKGGTYSDIMRNDVIGSFQVGPDGQVHQLDELEDGAGRGGIGGFGGYNKETLSYYRQKADTFWGSRNAEGQFIIPPEARNQREIAEQRMRELEIAGLPPQHAARYGNFSVMPPLSESDARKMAIKEAKAAGLKDDRWSSEDEFDLYVRDAVPQLMEDSKRAHEIYQALTDGGLDAYLDKAFADAKKAAEAEKAAGKGAAPSGGGISTVDPAPAAPAAPAGAAGAAGANTDIRQLSTEDLINAL